MAKKLDAIEKAEFQVVPDQGEGRPAEITQNKPASRKSRKNSGGEIPPRPFLERETSGEKRGNKQESEFQRSSQNIDDNLFSGPVEGHVGLRGQDHQFCEEQIRKSDNRDSR